MYTPVRVYAVILKGLQQYCGSNNKENVKANKHSTCISTGLLSEKNTLSQWKTVQCHGQAYDQRHVRSLMYATTCSLTPRPLLTAAKKNSLVIIAHTVCLTFERYEQQLHMRH